MRPFFNTEPDHLGLQAHDLKKLHALIQRGGRGRRDRGSVITHSLALEATYRFHKSKVCYKKKMAASCYGESIRAHSINNLRLMLRFSIMSILLRSPKIIIRIYLEYLETSSKRYTGEIIYHIHS